VIPRRELEQLRAEWSLDLAVIEKDYVLGWLLAGIAQHPLLGRSWVFKGGTCLRKCSTRPSASLRISTSQ
jgi:predicted nucleotidyltransferase component of viral defense system